MIAGEGSNIDFMGQYIQFLFHSLNNTVITKYLNYESRFNSAYSRDNLSKRKDAMYVLNLDEK